MSNCSHTKLDTYELQAAACLAQLEKSERGRACIIALAALLWKQETWSLDSTNQDALVVLLAMSLNGPTVRELVQLKGHNLLSREPPDRQLRLSVG